MYAAYLNYVRPRKDRRTLAPADSLFTPDLRGTSPEERGRLVEDILRHDPQEIAHYLSIFVEGTYEGQIVKDELVQQAERDALTGLFNRRAFDGFLKRAIFLASHKEETLSMILIDMDGFKPINDELGHPAGDKVLEITAKLLLHNTRDEDIVARIGGDEFAVLIPGAQAKDVYQIVDRLNRVFSKASCMWNNKHLPVRASVGVAHHRQGQKMAELINAADHAMYAIKAAKANSRTAKLTLIAA